MQIFSEDLNSFLTIEVLGIEPLPFLPSLYLNVEVNDEGFCGFNEIYVETDNLKKFVSDLQTCEQTRHGMARLVSYGELELTVESVDGWGHFALKYKISKFVYPHSSRVARTKLVSGWLDLDSSLFRQVASDFADLLPES